MRWALCVALGLLASLAVVVSSSVDAGEKGKKKVEAKVKVGDTAPTFEAKNETGETVKSSDVVGKNVVVLYFYPADFTGGCTAQACGFRDDIEKLKGKGITVFGVSGDNPKSHKLFKNHHKLPFHLLADEKGELAAKFGVPFNKGGTVKWLDKESNITHDITQGVRISRWTVVIDKAGKVAAIDQVGKAGDDSKRVADIVNKLATN